MDPQLQALLSQIDQMMTGAGGALTSTNAQQFNQQVAEFNANYGNAQAGLYGYNTGTTAAGIQYPSPYAPTLSAQQAIGSVGYIPGYSGVGSAQTLAGLTQNEQLAQQNAANTGFYNTPKQSAYTPGTFLQIDPSTYDYGRYGQQIDYVLPSGQLQRVTIPQAQKMGWNGNFDATIPFSDVATLESAPPQGTPVQTMASMQGYSNLNTAAENQALQQAGVTGMYQQPTQITAPGTNWGGQTFQTLDRGTQMAYYYSNGGDWNAAMNAWVRDSNNATNQANAAMGKPTYDPTRPLPAGAAQETMQAQQQFFNQALQQGGQTGYVMTPGTPGSPNSTQTGQETMQAQQQMFNQANQLGTEYGQYYSPMMPGATAQPGINTPQVGQITEQGREFNVGTAVDLSKLASSLSGPADYFKYLQALNGGNNILSNLYNGQAQPPGGAVGQTGGAQSLDNILGQFGLSSQQLTGGVLPQGTYGQAVGVQGQQPSTSMANWNNGSASMTPGWSQPTGPQSNVTPYMPTYGGQPNVGGQSNGFGQVNGFNLPTPDKTGQAQPSQPYALATGGASNSAVTGSLLPGGFNSQMSIANPSGYGGVSGAGGGVSGSYGGGVTPQISSSQTSRFNLPPPNQIQPAAYNSMSPSAQQFVQGAYQSAGYNPQDLNWFMNAATPAATNTTPGVAGGGTAGAATHFANPSSQSLFA